MNKTVLTIILNEALNPQKKAPQLKDRQEKQLAALRLKRARQKLPPEEASKPIMENPTLKANYETIYKHIAINGDSKKRAEAQRAIASVYVNGLLDKTPLAEISLKTFLGAGSFSAAFEDDAGHVIKCGNVRDGDSERDFYDSFLRNPSKDFVVHYYKTFKIPSDPGHNFYVAVTNKFLTFTEYAQFIQNATPGGFSVPDEAWPDKYYEVFAGRKEHWGKLWQIRDHMNKRKIELTPKNILSTWATYEPQDMPRDIGEIKMELSKNYGISFKDSTKILQQVFDAFCTQARPDVHLNNLGVNITSGMNNPSFFFFDR